MTNLARIRLHGGLQEANRAASIRHTRSAILQGQDDAAALTLAGFSIGMDGHDRGMRLSPFDPWTFAAFDAQAMSHLLRGRYDESCRAAYKSVQANPAHSITYVQLAAALAKLGRLDEARAAAARVLELQPAFRYSRQFAGVNCAPALADALGDALRHAGLPE